MRQSGILSHPQDCSCKLQGPGSLANQSKDLCRSKPNSPKTAEPRRRFQTVLRWLLKTGSLPNCQRTTPVVRGRSLSQRGFVILSVCWFSSRSPKTNFSDFNPDHRYGENAAGVRLENSDFRDFRIPGFVTLCGDKTSANKRVSRFCHPRLGGEQMPVTNCILTSR